MGFESILAGGLSLGKTLYDWVTAERDFDYQKATQQEIWNREDTAVQRRVADLKAAGLNPNLAAGSAAGAGAVVGRSTTPHLSGDAVGAALDAQSHVQQIRAQRIQNQILKNEKDVSDYNASLARYNYGLSKMQNMFDRAALYQQLGVKNMQLRFGDDGSVSLWSPDFSDKGYKIDLEDSPLMQQLRWQVQNNKNSAFLLQKDAEWYDTQQLLNAIGGAARTIGNLGSGYYNFNRR